MFLVKFERRLLGIPFDHLGRKEIKQFMVQFYSVIRRRFSHIRYTHCKRRTRIVNLRGMEETRFYSSDGHSVSRVYRL